MPKAFCVHVQALAAVQRAGPAILSMGAPRVTIPGSRPPTESLSEIRESKLLQHVQRKGSVVFSDGNVSWRSQAKARSLKAAWVNHQNKQWTKRQGPSRSRPAQVSAIAGTQVVDRLWKSLKMWVPRTFPRKVGHGELSREHDDLRALVNQFMYPKTPEQLFLQLQKLF